MRGDGGGREGEAKARIDKGSLSVAATGFRVGGRAARNAEVVMDAKSCGCRRWWDYECGALIGWGGMAEIWPRGLGGGGGGLVYEVVSSGRFSSFSILHWV